ncbi:hypothetical protein OA871_01780 [Paracoccaceae bacterium]|nr:hypothetical protein [Paracoccaceae bacterium]
MIFNYGPITGLTKKLVTKLILTFVISFYPMVAVSQYIEPDSRPIFRLDSSKYNLALINSNTMPTKITLINETIDRCFADEGTIKKDLKGFLSDQQWQIIEGNEAIAEFVILVVGGQLSGSDCLLAIKVSYERGLLLPVIGLEDETFRSDTFTNVMLSSVVGIVAQKKPLVGKYTLEKTKMLIKKILFDMEEAQSYHEENVALPYIAPN